MVNWKCLYDVVFQQWLRVIRRGTLSDRQETEEAVYREIVLIEERNMLWGRYLRTKGVNENVLFDKGWR